MTIFHGSKRNPDTKEYVRGARNSSDCDVVLWNGHPLSVYSKAERTMIEGATYFNHVKDKQMRLKIKKERQELMTMMLQEKNRGMKTQPIKVTDKQQLHCDSMD